MLSDVIQADNLKCGGEMLFGQIPDPRGAISQHNHFRGLCQAVPSGFCIKLKAKFFRCLNGS